MKNATKVASKFVVQVAHLLEVDRGGAPHFSAFRPLAVADSLEEAFRIAAESWANTDLEFQVVELLPPVVSTQLVLRPQTIHPVPKPAAKKRRSKAVARQKAA